MEIPHLWDVTVEEEVGDRATEKDYQQLTKEEQQVRGAVQNLENGSLLWMYPGGNLTTTRRRFLATRWKAALAEEQKLVLCKLVDL